MSEKRTRKTETVRDQERKVMDAMISLVEEHGYYGVINDLTQAVHLRYVVAMDDPSDRQKHREFLIWANAFEKMCEQLQHANQFEQRTCPADEIYARGLGISI